MKRNEILKKGFMENSSIYEDVRGIIREARQKVQVAVNSAMVEAYWLIGKRIVEEEQAGEDRAAYGKHQLQVLSEQLKSEFGKGFNIRNLRNMRAFYQLFPIRHALRTELSWTHYRTLVRVKNDKAREWYMNEAIVQSWSARALDKTMSLFLVVNWLLICSLVIDYN